MGTFYGRGLGFTAAFLAVSAVLGGSGYAAEIGKTLDEIVELAKKEPPVKIASTWRGEIIDDTVKGFKEKYGLTMELQFVSGLDDRERILNEALTGLVDSDLVNVSGELRDKFISAGVVEPIDWNALFPAIDSGDISPKGYFLGTGFNQFVLAYNKNRVAEADAPK